MEGLADTKEQAIALVKAKIDELSIQQSSLLSSVEAKLAEVKDGRDADEQSIIDAVLSRIPAVEIPEAETPETLRDKIETLTGEERIDKSAIKGIDEALEELGKSGKVTIKGTGPNYWQKFNGVTSPKFDTDLILANPVTNPLTPQVPNYMYGTIGDRPAAAGLPEGALYFVIP